MPREPDLKILLGLGKKKPMSDEGYGPPSGFGDEILAAIKAEDGAALESALRDAWAEWDEEPHAEGEHLGEEEE